MQTTIRAAKLQIYEYLSKMNPEWECEYDIHQENDKTTIHIKLVKLLGFPVVTIPSIQPNSQ